MPAPRTSRPRPPAEAAVLDRRHAAQRGCATASSWLRRLKKGSQIFPRARRTSGCWWPARRPTTAHRRVRLHRQRRAAAARLPDARQRLRLARDEIDLPSFVALADVCDEPVALVVRTRTGATTEPRYRSWGSTTTPSRAPTCSAAARGLRRRDLEDDDGRVAVRGGRWQPPRHFTITERMILGWDQLEEGDEAYNTFTRDKHTYTDPWHDYQPTEGDPWDDRAGQGGQGRDRDRAQLHPARPRTAVPGSPRSPWRRATRASGSLRACGSRPPGCGYGAPIPCGWSCRPSASTTIRGDARHTWRWRATR